MTPAAAPVAAARATAVCARELIAFVRCSPKDTRGCLQKQDPPSPLPPPPNLALGSRTPAPGWGGSTRSIDRFEPEVRPRESLRSLRLKYASEKASPLWQRLQMLRLSCRRHNHRRMRRIFTTSFPNFIQCAGGLKDGTSICAKILQLFDDAPIPEGTVRAFLEIDLKNAFNEALRQAALDVITGKAARE